MNYKWLEDNLQVFFNNLNVKCSNGIIVAHGDKCYSYKNAWEKAGIPFNHGIAIYLLSYIEPWSMTCRNTENGFVKPVDWVISSYPRLKDYLPEP